MAFKLRPRIQRTRVFCGETLGTTGLPIACAAEVFALRDAPREKIVAWISSTFLEVLPKCVFVIPEGTPIPTSPHGLEPVEGDELDAETLEELCVWVMGLLPDEKRPPLAPTAAEQPNVPSPSEGSLGSTPTV